MRKQPPKIVPINHDDYHAEHIGRTRDGRQFFLTTPFVPAIGNEAGREFIALYLFDDGGQFLEAPSTIWACAKTSMPRTRVQ